MSARIEIWSDIEILNVDKIMLDVTGGTKYSEDCKTIPATSSA